VVRFGAFAVLFATALFIAAQTRILLDPPAPTVVPTVVATVEPEKTTTCYVHSGMTLQEVADVLAVGLDTEDLLFLFEEVFSQRDDTQKL